jgi:outer membrane protein assembly factor BamB
MRKYIIILALLFILFLPPLTIAGENGWSSYSRDHRNTGYVNESGVRPGSWVYEGGSTTSVIRSGERIYYSSRGGTLSSVNLRSGAKEWSYQVNGTVLSDPLIHNGSVFLVTKGGTVHSLNDSGSLRWKVSLGSLTLATPAIRKDRVYVATAKGVYSVDAGTGEKLWKKDIEGVVYTASVAVKESLYITTALSNGEEDQGMETGALGSSSYLYSIDPDTGKTEWKVSIPSPSTAPAVSSEKVYLSSAEGMVYSISGKNGSTVWKKSTNYTLPSTTAVRGARVYVSFEKGGLLAINATGGTTEWKRSVRGSGDSIPPSVSTDRVYFGYSGGEVYSVNSSTGDVVWEAKFEQVASNSLVVSDRVVYFAGNDVYGIANGSLEPLTRIGGKGSPNESPTKPTSDGMVRINGIVAFTILFSLLTLGYLIWSVAD